MAQDCPSPRGNRRPVDSAIRNGFNAEGVTVHQSSRPQPACPGGAAPVNIGQQLARSPLPILNAHSASAENPGDGNMLKAKNPEQGWRLYRHDPEAAADHAL